MRGCRICKVENNLLTHDEEGWDDVTRGKGCNSSLTECVCLLSSIKLRLMVKTVNYIIIAGWEVTSVNCISLYGFSKITCRKFIDFLPPVDESMRRDAVEFNRHHRPSSSRITNRRNVNLCRLVKEISIIDRGM